jgi:hypothetical protein
MNKSTGDDVFANELMFPPPWTQRTQPAIIRPEPCTPWQYSIHRTRIVAGQKSIGPDRKEKSEHKIPPILAALVWNWPFFIAFVCLDDLCTRFIYPGFRSGLRTGILGGKRGPAYFRVPFLLAVVPVDTRQMARLCHYCKTCSG